MDDLLKGIAKQLNDANGLVSHLEDSLRPAMKELAELQETIKNMEIMEEISQQVQLLRKKLAWSWVYDADKKLDAQHKLIEKLKGRIPSCQAKIDHNHVCSFHISCKNFLSIFRLFICLQSGLKAYLRRSSILVFGLLPLSHEKLAGGDVISLPWL